MSSNLSVQLPAFHPQAQSVHLPVAIDYPAALTLRQMTLVQDELPKYLLAPEVSALLHYVPNLHRKMLLATLWNTGARINEALALTRGDFSLAPPYPFVHRLSVRSLSLLGSIISLIGFSMVMVISPNWSGTSFAMPVMTNLVLG